MGVRSEMFVSSSAILIRDTVSQSAELSNSYTISGAEQGSLNIVEVRGKILSKGERKKRRGKDELRG